MDDGRYHEVRMQTGEVKCRPLLMRSLNTQGTSTRKFNITWI
jgi:hypothetical protein